MLLWLLACWSGPPTTTTTGPLGGWIDRIVSDPSQFSATISTDHEGWIALHRNDWPSALAGGGAPASRATTELQQFYSVLSRLSLQTWSQLGKRWHKMGTLPTRSLLPLFFRFVADGQNDATEAEKWQKLAEQSEDPDIAALAIRFRNHHLPEAPENAGPLAERFKLHRAVLSGDESLPALRSAAARPVVVEPVASTSRALYDPLVYSTLQASLEKQPRPPLNDLQQQLFSSALSDQNTPEVLNHLQIVLPPTDDTDACRDAVRHLDSLLDPWQVALSAKANDDGRALLQDLRLVQGLRTRLLVELAVQALQDRPRCALALSMLALDHDEGRSIGPINSPTLYAVTAASWLATGHIREAMDALEALIETFPEVVAVNETIGDLAVLEAMGRSGDSREH